MTSTNAQGRGVWVQRCVGTKVCEYKGDGSTPASRGWWHPYYDGVRGQAVLLLHTIVQALWPHSVGQKRACQGPNGMSYATHHTMHPSIRQTSPNGDISLTYDICSVHILCYKAHLMLRNNVVAHAPFDKLLFCRLAPAELIDLHEAACKHSVFIGMLSHGNKQARAAAALSSSCYEDAVIRLGCEAGHANQGLRCMEAQRKRYAVHMHG